MKTLRQLFAVLMLTLTLTFSAFAGEMSTGRTGEMSTPKTGEMTTGITVTDIAVKTALSLYQSMLVVF